jgi:hypothetical protein
MIPIPSCNALAAVHIPHVDENVQLKVTPLMQAIHPCLDGTSGRLIGFTA